MWRELGVSSWPTFVIVGPNGKVLAQLSGEGRRKVYLVRQINYFLFSPSFCGVPFK